VSNLSRAPQLIFARLGISILCWLVSLSPDYEAGVGVQFDTPHGYKITMTKNVKHISIV
jgi:hypothetical protein